MKNYFLKNRKGFTLAELLAVMGIIAIMSGIVIASTSTIRQRTFVKNAAKEVESAIKEAQSMAITGRCVGADCDLPCGYGFHSTGGGYNIYYRDENASGTCSPLGHSHLVSAHSFDGKVNITAADIFTFIPHGNISGAGTITVFSGSVTKNVTVTPEGGVSID